VRYQDELVEASEGLPRFSITPMIVEVLPSDLIT
jgi:hypothetical protein